MNLYSAIQEDSSGRAFWVIVGFGLLALYLPTYLNAWDTIWQTEEHGHGPIIIGVLAWLSFHSWERVKDFRANPNPSLGFIFLSAGLLLYSFGRVFNISSIEFFSHLFIIPSVLIISRGFAVLRLVWFPVVYMAFLVPLPGSFVDAVTQPLKGWISTIVVELLSGVGYPIARSGVIITISQYQLLVADACSGLHSMFSLAALGVLFMFIMGRKNIFHNSLMVILILPIAFAANIMRVIVLILITYHFGDEMAQGFLHGAAGMSLMLLALGLFFGMDSLIAYVTSTGGRLKSNATGLGS
jgi:exosortase B